MHVYIENMDVEVNLDLRRMRPCKGHLITYDRGIKKGPKGTCRKPMIITEVNTGRGDWQPFCQNNEGKWINHFDDCIDASLFPKQYELYLSKWKPLQGRLFTKKPKNEKEKNNSSREQDKTTD